MRPQSLDNPRYFLPDLNDGKLSLASNASACVYSLPELWRSYYPCSEVELPDVHPDIVAWETNAIY